MLILSYCGNPRLMRLRRSESHPQSFTTNNIFLEDQSIPKFLVKNTIQVKTQIIQASAMKFVEMESKLDG